VAAFFYYDGRHNRFATTRTAYVDAYHHVAPTLRGNGDLSEGQLWSHALPTAGFSLPKKKGGCVWDVGANDGVWNSNSHYLIHQRGFKAPLS